MTLSEEWVFLSELMYGQEFIDELAVLLKSFRVKTILECGCGGGHILEGLARAGFEGIGLDKDPGMIEMANKRHSYPEITFQVLDWLDIDQLDFEPDAVICRGNSLPYVQSWDQVKNDAQKLITKTLDKMLQVLKPGGLLYLDTVSAEEIRRGGGRYSIHMPGVELTGQVRFEESLRFTEGNGNIHGQDFSVNLGAKFYTADNLIQQLKAISSTIDVFTPKLINEVNYDIVCAIKSE